MPIALQRQAAADIEFLPRVPQNQLPRHYEWGDIFLFPTLQDGYAVVLAQAQAAGLPMIATTNCAAPDLLAAGQTGWVFPIRRPDLFIERLRWCDQNRDELAAMVEATYNLYGPRDWSDVARDFVDICAKARSDGKSESRLMSLELELVWFVVVLGGVIALSWFGKGSCGLSLSYLVSLGFIHFWGGLIHAFSWYHGGEADFTQLGFDQFAWAMTGFALGNFAVAPLLAKRLPAKEPRGPVPGLATVALILGVILYGFLRVALSNVPSIGALASCGGSLFIAGVCLFGWEGLRQRNYVRIGRNTLSASHCFHSSPS